MSVDKERQAPLSDPDLLRRYGPLPAKAAPARGGRAPYGRFPLSAFRFPPSNQSKKRHLMPKRKPGPVCMG